MSDTGSRRSTDRPRGDVGARMLAGLPWLIVAAGVTALLVALRADLHSAHAALAYLVVVLLASSRLGRAWGVALAVLCFFSFNFFLLPPYYTLAVHDPLNWLVLLAFLLTGVVAAQLLDRARREAASARARAEEIDRFSTLGAETLNAGRAEEGVQAIARVLQERLGLAGCEIFLWDESVRDVVPLARQGAAEVGIAAAHRTLVDTAAAGVVAVEGARGGLRLTPSLTLADGLARYSDARGLVLPLHVRDRVVGVLHLVGADGGLRLDPPALRFAEALAYYAALGVERVRLVQEAERADALREADRQKDALLASVSHDLRTPLTTIKALAHEMRQDGDARAAAVEEESDRLNRYVTNLLDLSRLNSGAIAVAPELVPAEEVLGSALEQVAAACAGVDLRAQLPPGDDLLVGRFDPVLAVRCLVNLLENACTHGRGAPVEATVRRDGAAIVFSVADRGPGVPESERERIFEPFFRGAAAGDRRGAPGAGLGLSIARRLARAQSGDVTCAPRPGGGCVFELRLPADDDMGGGSEAGPPG